MRFHHRSALESLAARRVDAYLARGVSIRSIKRLLFVDAPQGERVVRPSLRPLAAWLSLWHPAIYEEVRQREPEVLLEFGDPQSLSPARRADLLTAFCDRFARGGWRGLSFPCIQIRRFGGPELAVSIERLWRAGIENSEVRRLLLQLIEAAKLAPCAWIVHDTLSDEHADEIERIYALDALDDARIKEVSAALAADALPWPPDLQRTAALRLFPDRMTIVQFCTLLPRLHEGAPSPDSWGGHLARLLRSIDGGLPGFDQVRHCLTDQLAEGVSWDHNTWPPLKGQRQQLAAALMAVCTSLLRRGLATSEVLRSTAIALRLGGGQFDGEEHAKTLRACLADAKPSVREGVFWADDAFVEDQHPRADAWYRCFETARYGPLTLDRYKDES